MKTPDFNERDEVISDFIWESASEVTLPASKIIISNFLYESGDLTFDFANGTGDNGLDTGAEANNQWYALYAVPGTAGAYKLKATANHPLTSGPTGFTQYRYLGMFRNGDSDIAAADIIRFSKTKTAFAFSNIGAAATSGLVLMKAAAATTISYTLATGMSGQVIPFSPARYDFSGSNDTVGAVVYSDELRATSLVRRWLAGAPPGGGSGFSNLQTLLDINNIDQIRVTSSLSGNTYLYLSGWIDPLLG